jgi:hypothetical protein
MSERTPRTADEFLAALAGACGLLADLRDDAERLGMPTAVTMGLTWLRDDATGVGCDAMIALKKEKAS